MELNISEIHVRKERQRHDLGDLTDLKASLLQIGLINPIVVELDEVDNLYYLIAGERRFTAWKALAEEGALPQEIRCTLFSSLDATSRHLIELEENIKRKDLTWQELAEAVSTLYDLKHCESDGELAEFLGWSRSSICRCRSVWANRDNPKVMGADNITAAYGIVRRENERVIAAVQNDMNEFLDDMLDAAKPEEPSDFAPMELKIKQAPVAVYDPAPVEIKKDPYENIQIQQGNFTEWVKTFQGTKFNLLHLDFPYGINHQKSEQGNTKNFDNYDDSPEVYFNLINALVANADKVMADSCTVICWLSLKFADFTCQAFEKIGFHCQIQPFIWYKSDNKGIIADTFCGMRNVGEYALVFTRNRRPVVKNIANIFPHPCTKKFHVSEKPLEMEKYLMGAFCDKYTRLLDPTCGSGTSIMASLGYGVEVALGLELDEDIATKAKEWLRQEKVNVKSQDIELNLDDIEL